jgi:hypothetical protein
MSVLQRPVIRPLRRSNYRMDLNVETQHCCVSKPVNSALNRSKQNPERRTRERIALTVTKRQVAALKT